MSEFERLAEVVSKSGCSKKQITAGTYVSGGFVWAVNSCEYEGVACPRLHLPSGRGYELCRATHAEAHLAAHLQRQGLRSDGIAWVFGHYWACEPCSSALKTVGVVEIRVRELT